MRLRLQNEIPGRMRLLLDGCVPETDIDALERTAMECPFIRKVTVYGRIGSMAVCYQPVAGAREKVIAHLCAIDAAAIAKARTACAVALAPRTNGLLMDLAVLVGTYFFKRWFLPRPLAALVAVWNFRRFFAAGIASLLKGRLDVPVLDMSAIAMSFIRRDPRTASQTMLLLDVGETLEEYTRARSENELISSLLDLPETAQKIVDGEEVSVHASELVPGDVIAVRTGMPISVDGTVEEGTVMVNQSALTGEPLAVERTVGDDVFAGTAVEAGSALVRVKAASGGTKLRSIVSLVEQSEGLKSESELRMARLADKVVPWNFLLAGIVALATRSLVKTAATLMVDYSCALKLTGSIASLTAMSQSAKLGFTVKGSKHFEAVAQADTVVFDKTGTLTEATPEVACVVPLEGWGEDEVLRLSACLEEHFPHPVARAVVNAAAARGLKHRERHAAVEYIVAHGIASSLDGKRVVIGSEHFVFGDEGAAVSAADRELVAQRTAGLSPLYLAVDGALVGVIGVQDPLKEGVAEAIEDLRREGIARVVMLTGDNERAAARTAELAGVTEFCAEMLPEEKYAYVERLKSEGARVIMVGDGVNDSPALSLADVGVAMGAGTAIAKEVADITMAGTNLHALVQLRRLSRQLTSRMDASYRQVLGFNSLLLAGGIAGVLQPQTSSLLHNASTVAFSARNARRYCV